MTEPLLTLYKLPFACWALLADMAPYLLLGFTIAGVLSVVLTPDWVEKHLGGRGVWQVLKAAAFGVPLPLCSCGVIPVAASLRRHGASRGAVSAFLLSTPQTGVDSILATYGMMGAALGSMQGLIYTALRVLAALVTGLVGGTVTTLIADEKSPDSGEDPTHPPPPLKCDDADCLCHCCCCGGDAEVHAANQTKRGTAPAGDAACGCSPTPTRKSERAGCSDSCCTPAPVSKAAGASDCTDDCCSPAALSAEASRSTKGVLFHILHHALVTLPKDIGKPLLIGMLLAGLISVYVTPDSLEAYLGGGILAMLAMMVVGVPLYVCATASIPLAIGFMHMGASPGAALVFLIAGPATNAATVTTIYHMLGRRSLVVYMLTIAVGSVAAGMGLDAVYDASGMTINMVGGHAHETEVGLVGHLGAGVLLGVMIYALWGATFLKKKEVAVVADVQENVFNLTIRGMTCDHCKRSVEKALRAVAGVRDAQVDLEAGRARVVGAGVDDRALVQAVQAADFEAELTSEE